MKYGLRVYRISSTPILIAGLQKLLTAMTLVLWFVPATYAEPSCDELNRLYQERYVDAFSIDRTSFDIHPDTRFACDGYDKNYILARAINDLEILKPQSEDDPYSFDDVAEVMQLNGNLLKYIGDLGDNAEASTFQDDGGLSTIFYSDKMIRSKEMFRPTYTLVHEARHTIIGKIFNGQKVPDEPGHVVCTRGKHKGEKACDDLLSKPALLGWGSGNSHEFLFLIFVRNHPMASSRVRREAREQLSYLATHMFNRLEPGVLEHYGVQTER